RNDDRHRHQPPRGWPASRTSLPRHAGLDKTAMCYSSDRASVLRLGQAVPMAETPTVVGDAFRCAARVGRLLVGRRLHLRRARIGMRASLPDERTYVVFRESCCDAPPPRQPVTVAVWFHLRAIPPGARVRRWLFERLCILNTVLFAGFEGFLVKLWMVNPNTSDYAGLYAWDSAE